VERSSAGRRSGRQAGAFSGRTRRGSVARRIMTALSVGAVLGVAVPGSMAGASSAGPAPSLKKLLAEASVYGRQIDYLSQQYDALRIQFSEARTQVRIARLTVRLDERLITADQSSIARIAAADYMAGGISPAIQLLQTSNPQAMLDRASILAELQQQNSDQLNVVASARAAGQRAKLLAVQQERKAARLSAAMQGEVAKIQAKENILNDAAFSKAMAIYDKTGHYPNIHVRGDSIGVQALRYALTRIGDPYVWGAAGPTSFDCSGLVVWAYAQIGISLPHFTGDLWNSGVHVARADLEPGDLVFFFPTISHVGIYVGNGMMLDAPQTGQDVQIQPVFWSAYVGAVRIA
jgi:peptidoglycan DL-endopeptidase CwlO